MLLKTHPHHAGVREAIFAANSIAVIAHFHPTVFAITAQVILE